MSIKWRNQSTASHSHCHVPPEKHNSKSGFSMSLVSISGVPTTNPYCYHMIEFKGPQQLRDKNTTEAVLLERSGPSEPRSCGHIQKAETFRNKTFLLLT